MAGSKTSSEAAISIGSYDTALSIIPPREIWPAVDRLRGLYDKAYAKWPPHINLVYPFVRPEVLSRAAEVVGNAVAQVRSTELPRVSLTDTGVFPHKHENTIYIKDNQQKNVDQLGNLRQEILSGLGQEAGNYQMHMTVAQSEDLQSDAHNFLARKVDLLPPVDWTAEKLYILVRERLQGPGGPSSQMKIWGSIDLLSGLLAQEPAPVSFYDKNAALPDVEYSEKDQPQARMPYYYESETELWMLYEPEVEDAVEAPNKLAVSSYNVLAEFEWPPSQARYPLILKNILSERATADVLVLQEITDDFLSYLLGDDRIREAYIFASHGPPEQPDIEPLPSFLNTVMLSKFPFEWEWVASPRKHKGFLVAKFADIGRRGEDGFLPLIISGVHLSHGLNDGAVTARKGEVERLLKYLSTRYSDNPWILAGDTNISTSSYSIETALNRKAISAQSAAHLRGVDDVFSEKKLTDAWAFARFELGEVSDGEYDDDILKEAFEGEQGATYDPITNELAASIVGSGLNMRPQRYDRILLKGEGAFEIAQFNMFGFAKEIFGDSREPTYASDHWGVRCIMDIGENREPKSALGETSDLVVPVDLKRSPENLSDAEVLRSLLDRLNVFPSAADVEKRRCAFDDLKQLIEGSFGNASDIPSRRAVMVTVPVGSYALGVWTTSSDIDCLCIGPFGTGTFFAVVTQRLRKAEPQGFRLLRRVKANTGTMLELEVHGIKVDLQYCPATSVAEQWPEVLRTRPSDPIWTLSVQTLSKLKAIRDLEYLRRSIHDAAKFRLAHQLIKTWAKSRGVYSAKFGYLGGIQITILLVRVMKLLGRETGSAATSVPDILVTFFSHYASFDWKKDIVFDPFFHKSRIQYTRTTREPLSILGYFPPTLNTSHAASLPSVRSIAEEFKRADMLLSSASASWPAFLCGPDSVPSGTALGAGATEFLGSYKSYVKIDAQFWGLSSARGAQFVGWLESRCVILLVDINRRIPGIHARIWPARFIATAEADEDAEQNRDYQGHYLVGLDKLDSNMGRDELKLAFGSLQTVLRRFEELIRGDEKYFDAKNCWMSAAVVNQAELGELKVDKREWGGYTAGEEESDEDEDEEALLEEGSAEWREYVPLKKKHQKGQGAVATAPKLEPGKKFRTAADVMNRLRWDPELDSSDYIVGYEDRFVGPMERALETWKLEQTDEEFIPQHRILWFKQKSTGKIVWERRTRKDEIFGSGVA